ncbi:hypothetical protein [Atopococcus tabaci]|uniref:hypothetical protein n=1 Tax=Atopococcus tabaci TaxID=269774 RepID=UPI000401864F|nr:hypothetical protein [Atopococcus tabaci]
MQNQTTKRQKKEVYVYERGYELFTMLGPLTEDQIAIEGLKVNREHTENLQKLLNIIVFKAKDEFAPNGFRDEETLHFVNAIVKNIFGEVVQQFDFNHSFHGPKGEFMRNRRYIETRVEMEREMFELGKLYADMLDARVDIPEDF